MSQYDDAKREAAREAFSSLDTTQKTAFVIEATFRTIGQAIEETGQHLASVLQHFDVETLFSEPEHRDTEAPASEPAPKASSRTTKTARSKRSSAKPKSTKPKASGSSKTAGKRPPKKG